MNCEGCRWFRVEHDEKSASLHLNIDEWSAVIRAMKAVPEEEQDPHWSFAMQGLDHLLDHAMSLRVQFGDPKSSVVVACGRKACKEVITRIENYVFDFESKKFYHMLCWQARQEKESHV